MVDESAFDQGLRQAAARQSQDDDDSDRSRDVRPGRGTETGTTQPIDEGGSSGSSSFGGGGSLGGGSSGGGGSSSGGGGSSGRNSDRSVDRRPGRGTEDRTEPIDDDGGGSSAGDADRSDGDADMQQDMQQDDATQTDTEKTDESAFDQGLMEEAERQDQQIVEDAVSRDEGFADADRELTQAAEEREFEQRTGGGFDPGLERERQRVERESQQERKLFDRELDEAAFEQARDQVVRQELDREDRVRAIQQEAEDRRARTQELRERTLTPTGLRRGADFSSDSRSLSEIGALVSLRLSRDAQNQLIIQDIKEKQGSGVLSPGQEQFLRDISDRVTGPAAAAVTSIFAPGEFNQNVIIDDPLRAIGKDPQAEAIEQTVADFSRNAGESVGFFIDFPQVLLGVERGIEFGQAAAATAREQGNRPVGRALTSAGGIAAIGAARRAAQNPAATAGGLLGDIAIGFGIGRVVGRGGTLVRDRVRTAGGQDITDAVTNPATRQFFDDVDRGRPADPSDRFPGAQDPDLLQRDPAAAVRQQADEFTPDEVTQTFEDAGVPEGSVLKKALDVEPEGPDTGRLQRAGGGLETRAGDYELPGSFFGPEVSPNFFRTTRRTGIRPGLPDFGGRPTAVFARTDVENPRARTRDEFADELVERAGEPTALGRPDPNPGEIEAVVPPGAQFRDIDRTLSRRVGIGSDFFVQSSGRRIPVRLLEPDRPRGDIDIDDITFRGTGTGTLDELSERLRPRIDRPSPVVTPGATSSSGSDIIDSDSGLFSIGGPSPPISSPGGPSSPSDSFGPSGLGGSPSQSTPPSSPSIAGPPSGSSSGSPSIDFPIPSSGGPGRPIFPRRTPEVTAPEGDLLGDEAIFEFEVPEL